MMAVLAYARLTALGASAAWYLAAHRLSVQLRGPSPQRALARLQRWSRQACGLLRVDMQVHGEASAAPCIYLSNHRSYLDIPVLSAALGVSFLSRADVAAWPVVGMVARETGAVFVDRDDRRARARAALAVVRRARRSSVVVFPEGTTSGDRLPGAFAQGVFRLVRCVETAVVPVTIRYSDRRAYWIDESTLSQHAWTRVLAGPRLGVAVHIGESLCGKNYPDARALAKAVYGVVSSPIEEFGELCGDSERRRASDRKFSVPGHQAPLQRFADRVDAAVVGADVDGAVAADRG